MANSNNSSQRSSLLPNDRRDSITSSPRIFSPVTFFHDRMRTSETDLRFNTMGQQRRAQAIATAPRRRRYDDDDEKADNGQTISSFGFVKTSAVPIPEQSISQQTQSLPQTQSGINLIPSFRVDPPAREDSDELYYLYNMDSHRNRCSSGPLP